MDCLSVLVVGFSWIGPSHCLMVWQEHVRCERPGPNQGPFDVSPGRHATRCTREACRNSTFGPEPGASRFKYSRKNVMTWSFSHSPSISVSASLRLSTTSPYETTTSVSATIARPRGASSSPLVSCPAVRGNFPAGKFDFCKILPRRWLDAKCSGAIESAREREGEGEAKLRTD